MEVIFKAKLHELVVAVNQVFVLLNHKMTLQSISVGLCVKTNSYHQQMCYCVYHFNVQCISITHCDLSVTYEHKLMMEGLQVPYIVQVYHGKCN